MTEGVIKDRKGRWPLLSRTNRGYGIDSKTKIKSLNEGLRQFEEPEAAVTHFIKYAEYTLPRSNLNWTLNIMLKCIAGLRRQTDDFGIIKERIKYTIGYMAWSLEGILNVLNTTHNEGEDALRRELEAMVLTELNVSGTQGLDPDGIVRAIMQWKNEANRR